MTTSISEPSSAAQIATNDANNAQNSIAYRDTRNSRASVASGLTQRREKSMTVDVDSADSSPAMVDIAAAKIAAINNPIRPTGICVTMYVGKT